MKSIMSRTPHESSFSFSRRHFHWIIARVEAAAGSNSTADDEIVLRPPATTASDAATPPPPRPPSRSTVARIRSALAEALSGRRTERLGPRVTGTLFGPRRGHVRFAFQGNPRAAPALLVELSMPTASLVKEMASGLVRIALECGGGGWKVGLVEERQWRAYCNGRKCGYAVRRECSAEDWHVLRAVEPVSMGAGVLPALEPAAEEGGCGAADGEVMYMRARFERVVGSKDSEAFYMMNPDGKGGVPELSLYLLRT